jgi:hypothetical protein
VTFTKGNRLFFERNNKLGKPIVKLTKKTGRKSKLTKLEMRKGILQKITINTILQKNRSQSGGH